MDKKIRNLGTLLVGSWLSLLPVTEAGPSAPTSESTLTVVLLLLLLIVLCVALILAWKRLIHTEGGEGYHPRELWGRARDIVQNVKNRWSPGNQEDDHEEEEEGEDEEEEEPEAKDEETDITAL